MSVAEEAMEILEEEAEAIHLEDQEETGGETVDAVGLEA